MLVGVAIRLAYVLITSGHTPVNDELVALAVAASVVVTTEAHTRYRAPLEPLIVVLACSNVLALAARWRARRSTRATKGGEIAAAVP